MTRPIPNRAVDFVAEQEGFRAHAYPDPGTGAQPWTVGYGHTGPEVVEGYAVTKTRARADLLLDLCTARSRIIERIGAVIDELSEPQFCALLSFVFNLGASPSWAIWRLLKARQFDQVPTQMMRFVNAGGRPMKGLVNRRTAEVALWHEDADDEALPSSVTRVVDTPPTPADTKPLSQSKSFVATAVAACASCAAAAGDGIKQVTAAITPFAPQSQHVQNVLSTLVAIAAALTVASLVFQWLKKRRA